VVIKFLEEKVEKTFYPNLPHSGEKRLFVLLPLPEQEEGCGVGNLIMQSIMGD
jgi:hypothetical protein